MKRSLPTKNNFTPYILLFVQPIFMATNTIVARGGVESVPPISLAFWRWFTVFIILFPFFFSEILKRKKDFNKEIEKSVEFNYLKESEFYLNREIEKDLLSKNNIRTIIKAVASSEPSNPNSPPVI